MKKTTLLTLAFALLALPSFGAIQYDFFQKSTYEGAIVPSSEFTARATIDGIRSRVEFLAGDAYPAGTYAISTDGAQRMYFVDPQKQWYTEYNVASAVTAVGASGIKIANLKSNVTKLPDVETISGIPTEHYQLTITYDITINYRGIPMTQNVRTVIDSRTTMKFGDLNAAFNNTFTSTGNPEVDKLIEAETTRIMGFPMRQTVTITLNHAAGRPQKSKLEVPQTRVITREMWVTAIREVPAESRWFTIPVSYRRADQQELPKAPPMQVLQMEPVSK